MTISDNRKMLMDLISQTKLQKDLVFGHKLHISTPYRGKRFLTRQIPTSVFRRAGVSSTVTEKNATKNILDGWKDGRTDGRMDGRTDGRTDGQR
jgi:hypothetical protein